MDLSQLNLTLFFTADVSLRSWQKTGNLNREIAIYQLLGEHLKEVNFVTYGGRKDRHYAGQLKKINVYPSVWTRSRQLNLIFLLARYGRMLKQTHILKTNQIRGSEIPIRLKKFFGKKLIVRCGYLLGRFSEQDSLDEKICQAVKAYEQRAFESADLGIVPTVCDRDWAVRTYGLSQEKLRVIPNYVDINIFAPLKEPLNSDKNKARFDIVFVGRSTIQKNLSSLLEAIAYLKRKGKDVHLLLIGDCAKDNKLKKIAEEERLKVTFLENVPNSDLPYYLHQAGAFILPSFHEGHPKALLEAMSCGLACIGTEVEGIKELITHRETGYLCQTDAHSIASAIEVVLADEALRRNMGNKAGNYIVENFSLEKVLKMELGVIEEVMRSS